jgi:ATP-dependent helicase/nuclease subunit A
MSGVRPDTLRLADAAARRAAQTVFDRALVLEAGAGTGKTSALVARVVCWSVGAGWDRAAAELAQAQPGRPEAPHPDRIAGRVLEGVVAITFTEAAAAEMAGRVARGLAALGRGEVGEGIDGAALPGNREIWKERARHLLLAVDRLRVSTIHAFCNRLLAANPAEAGVHPAFAVDADETRVDEIVRTAVGARLRREAHGPEADDLVTLAANGVGPDRIAAALASLVAAGVPDAALAAEPFGPERVAALAAALHERVDALAALLGDRFAGNRRNAGAIVAALGALRQALTRTGRHCEERGLPEAAQATEQSPQGEGDCVVAKPGTRLLAVTVGSLVDLKALLAEHLPSNLQKHLQGWGSGRLGVEENAVAGDVAGELAAAARELAAVCAQVEKSDEAVLRAACRVLAPLLSEVRRRMRSEGVLAYADLLGRCRDLLVEHPDVAARERRAIDQLVVDEFQDTDALQCEIVAALALDGPPGQRPGLFLVGDPKQSIYGWRNADLAAYEAFVDRVVLAGGARHALSVNFRSVPAVLDEVERCLGEVMVRDPQFQPAFEPLLACDVKRGEAGFTRGGRAPAEHWIIDHGTAVVRPAASDDGAADEPSGAAEVEARAVAADIAELHEREGVAWSEVGILMRATTDLPTYLQALRDAGVPYAVERDKTYYRRREILEASALVRAVLDPADHVALVAWLRSASVGVPDAALLPLWSRAFPDLMTELSGPDGETPARLREVIAAAAAATPPVPGLERVAGWEHALAAAVETLARARRTFAERPAAELVEELRTATLIEATEAARVLGVYRLANLDRFFRVLLDAMEESGSHPQAVLQAMRRVLRDRPDAEEARLRDAAVDAVRVMTIHKAKGLDFGHVYLVQTGRAMRNDGLLEAGAIRVGGTWELSLFRRPSPGWWVAAARTRRVAEAELVRTLYVAMTRARVRLVVSGVWPDLAAGKLRPGPSHLKLLAHRRGGGPDIAALAAAAEQGSRGPLAFGGVSWCVPAAGTPADRRYSAAESAALADPADVAAQARTLARLAAESGDHMARPWSAPASAEAHRLFDEPDDDEPTPHRRARPRRDGGRDVATAAGTAVHRVLERLDLSGDIAAQLAAAPPAIARHAAALAPADDPDAVAGRAAAILARLASSPLLARLVAIAPHVVARELAVLVPPADPGRADVGPALRAGAAAPRTVLDGASETRRGHPDRRLSAALSLGGAGAAVDIATGFVAGAIDLVYRDTSTGELVIADYKTDEIASEADLAEKVGNYRSQGAAYRRALQAALGLPEPPRFELWFLSVARVVSLE